MNVLETVRSSFLLTFSRHLLPYKSATRCEKTAILDEFCATCGCHRKHAIRVLRGFKRFTRPKVKKRGKPSAYQKEAIIKPLKEIWLAVNLPRPMLTNGTPFVKSLLLRRG